MMKQLFLVLAVVALAFAEDEQKAEQHSEQQAEVPAAVQPALQYVNHGGLLLPGYAAALRPAQLKTTTTTKVVQSQPLVAHAAAPVVAHSAVVAPTYANLAAVPSYGFANWGYPYAQYANLAHYGNYANLHYASPYVAHSGLVAAHAAPVVAAQAVHAPVVSGALNAHYASPYFGYYGYGLNTPLTYANYALLKKKK
ncbi:hypothetical protein HDE_13237 [Halotydeus destructor]|nr:hypothetical protein HDE_13237 [Halotydeus destructor]